MIIHYQWIFFCACLETSRAMLAPLCTKKPFLASDFIKSLATGVQIKSSLPRLWQDPPLAQHILGGITAEGSTNPTCIISLDLISVRGCPSLAIKILLWLLEKDFLYWFKITEIINTLKHTTSARNCSTWELKIHSSQAFIRQIKLSGWRDPWKASTKETCYTRV